ncbi:MAG: ribonucleoside-diphosphate reductase subunit alpha [Legionellales bacterium]|nr:ribonucleoside-diphosphate reductase subunit alpha [Legionellales bacterium]
MHVVKRNLQKEDVSFDKVLNRLKNLSDDLHINVYELAQKVCTRIYDGVNTCELDELAAYLSSSMSIDNPDYSTLASRIIISNHHKNTSPSFSETIQILYNNKDIHGNDSPLVSKELYEIVNKNKEKLNNYIDYQRDFLFDYFGFKTLERAYLIKINKKIIERPQHLWMRVSIGIHGEDIKEVLETYDLMSKKYFTHATPTLFNSGTKRPQLSSCFLCSVNDDSISGIYDSLKEMALISKYAGGIGIHIHQVRCKGSHIRGTNGTSNGIIPMLRVFNNTARYVDQAGKRLGSIAVYLETWHNDIEAFLELKKNHGSEEERCRDLFLALWVSDLFMKRVKENKKWSLMCPDKCRGLSDVYGEEFEKLYEKYEEEGKYTKQINAQDLWFKILEAQIEQGVPYILYKDAANTKSNQKNIGTIKSSNLCAEVLIHSSPEETGVCNLASICLPTYVNVKDKKFDFEKLHSVVKVIAKNLNKVIDINFYPVEKARVSNLRHRPIGIGVQGLADVFMMLKYPFESKDAAELNKQIFETIYHGAVESSMELSKKRGEIINDILNNNSDIDINKYVNEFENNIIKTKYKGAYSSFEGSPISQGLFQFDLWNEKPSDRYDWEKLRNDIKEYGIRNSLLLSPMPTASTSQIMGFNESFEPFTNNIFQRKTLSGEFIVINKYLIKQLIEKGLWNKEMKDTIILHDGSIQNIPEIDDKLKELYKTSWEIKQRVIIDMSADRGKYICQTQSLNIFMEDPDFQKLSSMHFYGHSKGLKTGSYYLRTRPKAKTQQFTIDPEFAKRKMRCANENGDSCELCSA